MSSRDRPTDAPTPADAPATALHRRDRARRRRPRRRARTRSTGCSAGSTRRAPAQRRAGAAAGGRRPPAMPATAVLPPKRPASPPEPPRTPAPAQPTAAAAPDRSFAAASASPPRLRSPRPPASRRRRSTEPLCRARRSSSAPTPISTASSTLAGDFVQIGGDGRRLAGKLYLQRPGKIRFEYDAPATIEVVADGSSVAVRDRKLATQDLYSIAQTPLKFLLRDRIDLGQDIRDRRRRASSPRACASCSRTSRRSAAPRRSRCSSTRTCSTLTALAHRRPAGLHDHRRAVESRHRPPRRSAPLRDQLRAHAGAEVALPCAQPRDDRADAACPEVTSVA